MISYAEFLDTYSITDDMMEASGFEWQDLKAMYEDFSGKVGEYEHILADFQKNYLNPLLLAEGNRRPIVHSLHSRVKLPEHLIAKAVRKKNENFNKYAEMDASNYEKFFTDLAGVRCLLLFKADWQELHKHLVKSITNEKSLYLNNKWLENYNSDTSITYHAEPPKVHIRNGDDDSIYLDLLSPEQVNKGKIYRSAHYIIKYEGIYLEIQARTLFEESWGEIDHAVVYPYHTNDPVLKEYTELLNRLTGLADEMAAFFVRVQELEEICTSTNSQSGLGDTAADWVNNDQAKSTGLETIETGDVLPSSYNTDMSPLSMVESIVRSE